VHNVGDDLESFVHVLTWAAIKYARNDLGAEERTHFLKGFDSIYGGVHKEALLRQDMSAIVHLGLDQRPFSAVLETIYSGFGHRYGSMEQLKLKGNDKAAAEAELKKLETHDWLHNVLQQALKDDGWKAAQDGRVYQDIIVDDRHLTERQKNRRKSLIPEYKEELNSSGKCSRRRQ